MAKRKGTAAKLLAQLPARDDDTGQPTLVHHHYAKTGGGWGGPGCNGDGRPCTSPRCQWAVGTIIEPCEVCFPEDDDSWY